MSGLSVLLIGSGAREHIISSAYEKSQDVDRIIVAPGNDFIGFNREKEIIVDGNCSLRDLKSLTDIVMKYKPDLIDVAQDDALALGTVDNLQSLGFNVFGPKKEPARIEWDKKWSREFQERNSIEHPHFRAFAEEESYLAKSYVTSLYKEDYKRTIYVKASGLCEGKGALKSSSLEEALENIDRMKFLPNNAGKDFLIEEGITGEFIDEFSDFVISDGKNYKRVGSAQDYKRELDNDEGGQTGSMGSVFPAKVTFGLESEIDSGFIKPVVEGLDEEGSPFVGVLYFGGIKTDGNLKCIEYNARWGDSECQVVLPSFQTDYLSIVEACLNGKLDDIEIEQDNKKRVCVVGASKGYPNDYSNAIGKGIYGLEDAMKFPNVKVFGAGIRIEDGNFYTNGGRLFSVVGEGNDFEEAREKAYGVISRIFVEGGNLHYRDDIGLKDVEKF